MRTFVGCRAFLFGICFVSSSLTAFAQYGSVPSEFTERLKPFVGTWNGTFQIDDNGAFTMSSPVTITGAYALDSTMVCTEIVIREGGIDVKSLAMYGWDIYEGQVVRFTANKEGEMSVFKGNWLEQEPGTLQLKGEKHTKKGIATCLLSITFPDASTIRMDYNWTDEHDSVIKGHIEARR